MGERVAEDLGLTVLAFAASVAAVTALALRWGRSWREAGPEDPVGRSGPGQDSRRTMTAAVTDGAPTAGLSAELPPPRRHALEQPVPQHAPYTRHRVPGAAVKVPAVTAVFWLVKVLTTGTGEAAADGAAAWDLPVAVAVSGLGLVAALWWQLRADRFHPGRYWTAVTMVAVFGTMVADGPHVLLGLPYPVTAGLAALALAVVFAGWHRLEGTLDVHSITTRRRELLYWAAVLTTFALGTALGDLAAVVWRLGFAGSIVLFAAAIVVPWVGWARFGLPPVVAFWAAYVLTRPLGASVADWLGKPAHPAGGLGLGDVPVAAAGLVLIAVLVTGTARRTNR
ncbi:Uncharacterized membrane-anchored protein [Klenkia soli]|uniref:Uncharacterized membrane-anchored protein n=1 Tax=Klenkia soli TaxID=1052260 RepID=A0A1H0GN74_9ACTN|nr:hypothetical protein [Klenkia soli]SDO08456.1 Uncharacterized membrane-anchored protein [Klenkia soli]